MFKGEENSGNTLGQSSGNSANRTRIFPLLLCTVGGLLVGYFFLGPMEPSESAAIAMKPAPIESSPERKEDLMLPSPSLTPDQVVEVQMQALANYKQQRSAIHQVFAFASPANRAVTGPIDRFEKMIQGEAYHAMVESDYWMAGRSVSRDDQATVLVTTIDPSDQVMLYRFYLSKQDAPYDRCWMTDRVIRLIVGKRPPAATDSTPESI